MQEVTLGAPQSTSPLKMRNKKEKKTSYSDTASSNNCSYATSFSKKGVKIFRNPKRIRVGSLSTPTARRTAGPSDVDALGLPLGMSIAAFVAQVLERKNTAGENMSADYLSRICGLAVRESLGNVFGDKFETFAANFENSFQSTLMTLRLLSGSSQNVDEQVQRHGFRRCSCSADKISSSGEEHRSPIRLSKSTNDLAGPQLYHNGIKDPACSYCQRQTQSHTDENMKDASTISEFVVHNKKDEHQLICSNSNFNQFTIIEKSVMEQTRSNNLKTFEIELRTRKLQLMEKQLELSSTTNLLERWKLSMGVSKAAFRAEKFKTQLLDSRQVELLKKCNDFLVAGLFTMLFSLGYGTYVHSHRRIIEITKACSLYTESKPSWRWMPKSILNLSSDLSSFFQFMKCQFQVLTRIGFGFLMIGVIAFMLFQRSSYSHQTMPVTVIVLLLGVMCGFFGKLCVDTLGGSGSDWLIYWEALCSLHFFSNVFHSYLYLILNGPVTVLERGNRVFFAYWVRRMIFFTVLLIIPVLCGLMPYAGLWEWCEHFQLRASELLRFDDESVLA